PLEPLRRVVRLAVPDVPHLDVRQRDLEHPRADAADHQRRSAGPGWVRQELAVAGLEEPSVKVDRTIAQERADDGERLLEARDAVIEREAEGAELGIVPAR